ncbi:hypothetical protein ABTK18_19905, partial [Acinetobacter baumannii]
GTLLGESKTLESLSPQLRKEIQVNVSKVVTSGKAVSAIVHGETDICLISCVPVRSGSFLKGAICLLNQLGRDQAKAMAK